MKRQSKKLSGTGFKTTVKTGKKIHDTLEEGRAAGIEYLEDINVMVNYLGALEKAIYSKNLG